MKKIKAIRGFALTPKFGVTLRSKGGFTVVELIIVLAIMVTITSLILANYPGFNERLAVRGASEDIASNIRLAQAYGLGVKESSPDLFPGYGVYFQSAITNSYVLFADIPPYDGTYQESEKIKDLAIQTGVQIYDLCANVKQTPPGTCGLASLTAFYKRPTPIVSLKGEQTIGGTVVPASDIEIKIRGARGTTKTIVVWLSGQISVEEQ
ncbi:MAG: hypothetical protein Q8N42_01420 [bacterium]|nr:hypothetical protein [bacterium]